MHERFKPFWQLHLSTAFAIMLISAVMLGANISATPKLYVWPPGVYSTRGWPCEFCLIKANVVLSWNYGALAFDSASAIGFVLAMAGLCEWFTRAWMSRGKASRRFKAG